VSTATCPRTTAEAVAELRAAVRGRVIVPGAPDYDRARTVYFATGRRPAAVIRATGTADVVRTVQVARDHGLELAVRGGGHSPAAHASTDGGIVLDLAELASFAVDPDRSAAWAGAGLTAGRYTAAAARHGLATGFGDTASVGIGGITLSGGIGLLVRRHGMTIDNLLGADVVTADGVLRRVDAATYPDLFWAIRGGGGNFGVATRLHLRLNAVDAVVGGTLMLPATPQVLAAFLAEAHAAADRLTTIVNVLPAGPAGMVLRATLVHVGGPPAGEQATTPFRRLAAPIADTVGPTRYASMLGDIGNRRRPATAHRTLFLDAFDTGVTETVLDHLLRCTAPTPIAQLRILGGAMARVDVDATAFAHRTPRLLANLAALDGHPDDLPEHRAWVDAFAEALHQRHGAAAGFLGDEGPAGVREAYPGRTWDRLVAVKARYDPTNLFRLNQNIPPARTD
jgi:FAD/FMN-containing dehydrogenase